MKFDMFICVYIFIIVVGIFVIRVIFGLIMFYVIKKYNKKRVIKNKRKIEIYKNTTPKTDEELAIVHKNNVKKIGIYGQENYDEQYNNYLLNQQQTKIVGIVKPIGKWTRLILGQRVVGLMQHATLLKQQNTQGYWVNMIHSQRRARGREKYR